MKFKSLSLALLVASIGLNATHNELPVLNDECASEFVETLNAQSDKIDSIFNEIVADLKPATEVQASVQLPVEELITEQIENIMENAKEVASVLETQAVQVKEKVEELVSSAIEEKPVSPSSYEVWGKRVADLGTLTKNKLAALKQSMIENGGHLIQLGKDNPYYVAAGVAAVIVIGGATYFLYKNGYVYRTQYKIRSAIRSASEYRKTFAVAVLFAAAGAAGFAAYKLGYITPEMLDTAKQSVSSRLPNMPEINFQDKLNAAKSAFQSISKSVVDNASALKVTVGNKLTVAQEVAVNSASNVKDAAVNAAGSVQKMVSAQAKNTKDVMQTVKNTVVNTSNQKATDIKNAFNQSKDWAYSFFAK